MNISLKVVNGSMIQANDTTIDSYAIACAVHNYNGRVYITNNDRKLIINTMDRSTVAKTYLAGELVRESFLNNSDHAIDLVNGMIAGFCKL